MSGLPSRAWRLGDLDWPRPVCEHCGLDHLLRECPSLEADDCTDVAAWLAGRFETLATNEFELVGDGAGSDGTDRVGSEVPSRQITHAAPHVRPSPTLRAVSYGGGVQSTALLVLAAQRRIDFPLFIFANTGDDSERPATLDYIRNVAMPYAQQHDIELVERHRIMRDGTSRTLLGEIRTQDRSIPIPVRMGDGGFGRKRCTDRFKIAVVRRELRRRGATVADPATVAIGISVDEIERAGVGGVDPKDPSRLRAYPLLDLGLTRADCRHVISDAGLPVPPKSACVFCPLHDRESWRRMRRERPDEWATAIEVDDIVRTRAASLGRGAMGLGSSRVALADVVDDQPALFEGDGCDSGWCMT